MVFCNSIASGVLITGGLFVGDPWLGTCSAISLVSATAMARLASGASPTRANAAARFGAEQHSVRRAAAVDDDMVSNGLASYNGALVGCAQEPREICHLTVGEVLRQRVFWTLRGVL